MGKTYRKSYQDIKTIEGKAGAIRKQKTKPKRKVKELVFKSIERNQKLCIQSLGLKDKHFVKFFEYLKLNKVKVDKVSSAVKFLNYTTNGFNDKDGNRYMYVYSIPQKLIDNYHGILEPKWFHNAKERKDFTRLTGAYVYDEVDTTYTTSVEEVPVIDLPHSKSNYCDIREENNLHKHKKELAKAEASMKEYLSTLN